MSLLSTRREQDERKPGTARLLTYVLGFDDLTANDAAVFPLTGFRRPIMCGRVDDGDRVALGPDGLRVRDEWASSSHASIQSRRGSDALVDEGSSNGTFVNGARITEHRLADGDLIEIGHSLFCYRIVEEPLAAIVQAPAADRKLGAITTLCPEIAALLADLRRIAASNESVLVLGETGSGKEVIAEAVHELSARKGELRAIDCGAVPENLFESTFFGHKKGAFTGAADNRTGEIVRADRGTVFLDEVANMNITSQAKLLRVIENGKVTPLGAAEPVSVDVRWIAATNRDLFGDDVPFRDDLLRRLASYVARIPPLRERREDLGSLSAFLLRDAGIEHVSITAAAGRLLYAGPLPGNIRQLKTTLRSAAILAAGDPIEASHLSTIEAVHAPKPSTSVGDSRELAVPTPRKGSPSRDDVAKALSITSGNVVQASKALGIHARQLYRLIERHDLVLDDYR